MAVERVAVAMVADPAAAAEKALAAVGVMARQGRTVELTRPSDAGRGMRAR